MKWSFQPDDPGRYLLQRRGHSGPIMVQVDVEDDSHNLFYVLLPGDRRKYPVDHWPDALWFGPIAYEH